MMFALFDPATHDASRLAGLHGAAFADPWDVQAICELLAGPGVFAFFADDGFILARVAGGEAEILTLAVTKAARGRGLGRGLVTAAARHAAELGATVLFLEVGADNPPALALYARLGFVRVGQRKGYYHAGGTAWVMKAELPLSPGEKFA